MNWEQIQACWEDSELLRQVDVADLEVWADQFPAVPLFKALMIRKQILEHGSPDPVLWQRLLLQWPEPDMTWLLQGGRRLSDPVALTGAVPGDSAPEQTQTIPQPEEAADGLHLALPHLGFLYKWPASEPVSADSGIPATADIQEKQHPASPSADPAEKAAFSLEGLLPHLGFLYSMKTPESSVPTTPEVTIGEPFLPDSDLSAVETVDPAAEDTAETMSPLHISLPHLGFLWQLPDTAPQTVTARPTDASADPGDSAPVIEQNTPADLPQPPASRIFSSMEQDKYIPQVPGEDTDPDTGYHPSSFIRWLRSRPVKQDDQPIVEPRPARLHQASPPQLIRPEETDTAEERKAVKGRKKDKKDKKKKKKDKKQHKKEALEAFIYKSLDEPEGLVSETFAALLAEQGHHDKAIQMYERLGLRYPEKSSFFASVIEDLKKRT